MKELKYSIKDLEADVKSVVDKLALVRKAKGADYSGGVDTFANLRSWGSIGVAVRIGDKVHRLTNIMKSGKVHVKDESLLDTVEDLINYAIFLRILLTQESENA
tara:strand:- start:2041 stop:2352 length:312 start_codon:yes stop_codon:yes gene_type:complete